MREDELIAAILTTTDPQIDQFQIDLACIQRLKHVCVEHGREGDIAIAMLDMVKFVLGE